MSTDEKLSLAIRLCNVGIFTALVILLAACSPHGKPAHTSICSRVESCEAHAGCQVTARELELYKMHCFDVITNKYVLPEPHETLDPGTSTAILFDAW